MKDCLMVFKSVLRLLVMLIVINGAQWVMAAAEAPVDGIKCITLTGHTETVCSALFSPDGSQIVTISQDHTARIWNARTGNCERVLIGHGDWVTSAAFSPDGTRIVTASADRTARIWNTRTGACERILAGHGHFVYSATFSPDGTRIITASDDNTARVWNASTGICEFTLRMTGPGGAIITNGFSIYSALFSPDGTRIVTASADRTARIWNVGTGYCEHVLTGHEDWVTSAVFSPDGLHIVTASIDHTARVWNSLTGGCERILAGHGGPVYSAAFSSDGNRIVTASFDGTARLWNSSTAVCEHRLAGHLGQVYSAACCPDGTRIVTASADSTARIWTDTRAREQTRALALALACAQHPRLGADSPASLLDPYVMREIASFGLADSFVARRQARESKYWCLLQ